jgi:ketosteroid isomerase-like protein
MSTSAQQMIDLVDRIIKAAETGDPSDLPNIYAPDAVIWHNHDKKDTTVQQNMRVLAGIAKYIDNRRYEDRRIHTFEDGLVQQHRLTGIKKSTGEKVQLDAVVVIKVKDGRITRLDEYFDSAEAVKFSP